MKKFLLVTLVLVAGAVAVYFAFLKPDKTVTNSQTSNPQHSTQDNQNLANGNKAEESQTDSTTVPETVTITYTNNGFSPGSVKVKNGGTVVIKNESNRNVEFDSDPHPVHTDNQELNIGVIAPGESKSIPVNVPGTHGYHNHLNASETGILVVE